MTQPSSSTPSHNLFLGYVLWIFGFMGAHRFYYGKQLTGTLWFFTLGFFLIGWLVDLLLIPAMSNEANTRFRTGRVDYSLSWILLTFTGIFGLHRFYMGKYLTGIVYLLTGGLFLIGVLYDYWTLNQQVSDINSDTNSAPRLS